MSKYTFPVSPQSYFRFRNRISEKKRFLRSETCEPEFQYLEVASLEEIDHRIAAVEPGSAAQKALRLTREAIVLRQHPSRIKAFRSANLELYRAPHAEYVKPLLEYFAGFVKPETEIYWQELEELLALNITAAPLTLGPRKESFERYRQFLRQYVDLSDLDQDIPSSIETLLARTGLDEEGWHLRLLKGAEHARTYHKARSISVGAEYAPRKSGSARRIAVHEVIGHAKRGPQATVAEAEGFAILLEQLTLSKFTLRRSFRYLAAALAWGAIGKPLTFRETFERLWRIMVVATIYDEEEARSHAFNECTRVFRGGMPAVAGAVYLKDAVYFDANIAMWRILSDSALGYNEFIECIEGKRALL
jgi:hypothetical protein